MRFITSNHNMFKEAIEAFHPERGPIFYSQTLINVGVDQQLYDYLTLDFELPADWNFGDLVIEKSEIYNHTSVDVSGNSMPMSFVSRVRLPRWVNYMQGHLYTLGLSSVISFCTGRPVYSLRDSDLVHAEESEPLSSFLKHGIKSLEETNGLRVYVTNNAGKKLECTVRWTPHFPDRIEIFNDNLQGVFLTTNDSHEITNIQTQNIDFEATDFQVVKRNDVSMLACLHPIVWAGPGATKISVSEEVIANWEQRIANTFSLLNLLEYDADGEIDYCKSMQAMRLVQLSHHSKREDFDLSYTLMVAAIEAIAQVAIPAEKIDKHSSHNKWKKNKEKNPGLFEEYCNLREIINNEITNRNLTKRFSSFILEYCPIEDWDIVDESKHGFGVSDDIRSQVETKPDFFTSSKIKKILTDTYKFRSTFVHTGAPMPHQYPDLNRSNRFFEKVIDREGSAKFRAQADKDGRNTFTHEEYEKNYRYLITHNALSMIARKAISNYLQNVTRTT